MNRCSSRSLAAVACVFLTSLGSVIAQDAPDGGSAPLSISADDVQVFSGAEERIFITVTVSGGAPPYTIDTVLGGTIAGGELTPDATMANGPGFDFEYTVPQGAAGIETITFSATDSAGAQDDVDVDIVVCLADGAPLCLVPVPNENLEGVFDFEPEVRDDAGEITEAGTTGSRLVTRNLAAAAILNQLDMDGDGLPDNSPDTDGDGLPDNWEVGGFEALTADGIRSDRVVFFPAPSAIVPGTPPTPIFSRLKVATDALNPDSDGDGISDFVEVFGLNFIDENRNGILDSNEWADINRDGLPSPGEYPWDNSNSPDFSLLVLSHDFDGFIFTDPTNPDTDGDGAPDGTDNDPLINPRSFGIAETIIVRFDTIDDDIDNDGLGNGMDMGNDLVPTDGPGVQQFQVIDNPANVRNLLDLFRADLLGESIVPESAIEDLLGADWDGNGLWRTTDVRTWSIVINPNDASTRPPDEFFTLDDGTLLYSPQPFSDDQLTPEQLAARESAAQRDVLASSLEGVFNSTEYDRYSDRGIGLGWQDLLKPPLTTTTEFIPDRRVWAILYSWRLPGFDIDGDGFIGVPNLSNTATTLENGNEVFSVALASQGAGVFRLSGSIGVPASEEELADLAHRPFDDRINIGAPEPADPELDGVIEVGNLTRLFQGFGCGAISGSLLIFMTLSLVGARRFGARHRG